LVAEFGHSLEEICIKRRPSGLHTDKADPQHLRVLLRTRGERPRGCRATEKLDELSPPHVPLRLWLWRRLPVGYRAVRVSRSPRQVLGADLKCSESRPALYRGIARGCMKWD
jgi:hypothetical protein